MSASPLVRMGSVVLDCPDPKALADFYAALLDWPQMIHFDLRVDDLAAAAAHAVAVGARPLDLTGSHPTFQVYADPAGHPFCLCTC